MKFISFILILCFISCKQDIPLPPKQPPKTKYVFIVVMDGLRYSESWGHPTQLYIPNIKSLAAKGTICTNFWNPGTTSTVPGHTAIITGYNQNISNAGTESPYNPSIFQYYLSQFKKPANDAWIFASKDKLEALSDCSDPAWKGKFRPRTDCGINGSHTGYRDDSITYRHLIDTLAAYHPHLVLVNFQEPDVSGHSGNWINYLNAIKKTDNYIGSLWNYLQSDSIYSGKTTLFVTNDHGRHLDGINGGFPSHGCDCKGCQRIFLFAIGPDIKENHIDNSNYSLTDIAHTVAKLMNITFTKGEGKVMNTILK